MAEDKYISRHTGQEIDDAVDEVLNGGGNSNINASVFNNMESMNDRLNGLIRSLANLAFNGQRPEEMELDWDGTKYIVSLDTSGLDGATIQETFPKQVIEGNSVTITIVPTSSGQLLRSASYKVGEYGASTNVTIVNNKAVITINNVIADMTIYVIASASEKGQFTASISDSRVSGTGALSGIEEGSAWSTQLSINNTAEEGAAIVGITASMAGGGTISVSGNTISTNNVTGNITINVVVQVVAQLSVSLADDSFASINVDHIGEGAALEAIVSPKTFCKLTAAPSVTMSGNSVANASTDNGDGTYTIRIAQVTGAVVISAVGTDYNVEYSGVKNYVTSSYIDIFVGKDIQWMVTKRYYLGSGNGSVNIKFRNGSSINNKWLMLYNEDGKISSYYAYNSENREISLNLSSTYRYVSMMFPISDVSNCWLDIMYEGDTQYSRVFNGSTFDTNTLHTYEEHLQSGLDLKPNEHGDYEKAMMWHNIQSDSLVDSHFASMFYYGFSNLLSASLRQRVRGTTGSICSWGVSGEFLTGGATSIVYSAGEIASTPSTSSPQPFIFFQNSQRTNCDYFQCNETPAQRTSLNSSYTIGRFVFRLEYYLGCFARKGTIALPSDYMWNPNNFE